ncbi:MAG: hypothetical protein NZ922_00860 [Candidatus Methanomethyliaceae archaeon]|nr:hypothetical protein [Candidatus Methanomethyliaceae archaeon]MDW7970271.1 hypothetical protein [Nitrososphaerota archaeon]
MKYCMILAKILIILMKYIFFTYAFIWQIVPKSANSLNEVLKLFYLDFLRVGIDNLKVIRISNGELITRCRNPCPILWLSIRLGLDTRNVCKEISEPVCKYFLKKLNPNLVFERNYNYIRPYKESCEERIYLKNKFK